ncbi:hypothetical protein [Pseudoclavibacter sp. AY1H1]|uniref:hypothetical protein n=1 Tax=Pseudoclavibacter sp. AY1H1 TaxID=2080584 RepID=UPI000CE8165A|nr:hypothetical protein [Pseudoclavibacter sp. AY1H1]PPF39949.1 hypothetical protein C5E05_01685 [Pseudoclavibacter sp. AY1H1]
MSKKFDRVASVYKHATSWDFSTAKEVAESEDQGVSLVFVRDLNETEFVAGIAEHDDEVADAAIRALVPSVPFPPAGTTENSADADYYRSAAESIRFQASRGNAFAGSNVTETVAKLCDAVADSLTAAEVRRG